MQRALTDTESSNQCRKFKWIFRCWTGFNLISGFHSSMSFHFVLIFSHCCHTKNAKIRINSLANIDFMCKKNWQTYLLSPILPPELFIYAEKKSVWINTKREPESAVKKKAKSGQCFVLQSILMVYRNDNWGASLSFQVALPEKNQTHTNGSA